MSEGYTPVFSNMLEGTLYGRWPHTGIWACLLSLVDRHGQINKNPQLIANAVGVPIDQLLACIKDFMAPDPESQSQENEGRRLELIDPNRDWGWRVINSGKYREKARLMGKAKREVEEGKNTARLRDRRRPPKTAEDRLSDLDLNTDLNKDKEKSKREPKRALRKVPSGFELTAELRSAAVSEAADLDVDAEFAKFRDHEFRDAHSDWEGTWRNWVRRGKEQGRYARKPKAGTLMYEGKPVVWDR